MVRLNQANCMNVGLFQNEARIAPRPLFDNSVPLKTGDGVFAGGFTGQQPPLQLSDRGLLQAAVEKQLRAQRELGFDVICGPNFDSAQVKYSDVRRPASDASAFWMQRTLHEIAKQKQAPPPPQQLFQGDKAAIAGMRPPPGLEGQQFERTPSTSSIDESSSDSHSSNMEGGIESNDRLDGIFSMMSAKSAKTTLMIRNVPVLYTRELLSEEWPSFGTYDFLYLPYSCSTQRNLSYAFMNFTSEAAALAFVQQWHKKRLPLYTSRKPLNISFADVQGLDANLWELKKKRVTRIKVAQCQPMLFNVHGERMDLMDSLNQLTAKASQTLKAAQPRVLGDHFQASQPRLVENGLVFSL